MLDIDNAEVIAAQAAGSYATDTNDRSNNLVLKITGPAFFSHTDQNFDYDYYVPIVETRHGVEREAHIIVIIRADGKIVGCFLR
jgi:hypothetical protein